jgi:hypothetical protein
MRRAVLIVLLLALTACPARAAVPALGVVADSEGWGPGTGTRQDLARQVGARWIREPFKWSVIQTRRGAWSWARYDRTVGDAARRGLHVIANLLESPSWAALAWNAIPSDPAAFARFAAAVAGRYGPGGAFWRSHPGLNPVPVRQLEIWNEPYFNFFSFGGVSAARYARLVRAAGRAVRARNRRVGVMLEVDAGGSESPTDFVDSMYRAVPDLNRWFATVAVHPYSRDRDPRHDRWFSHLGRVRAHMLAHGAHQPFWITEIGWTTCAAGHLLECVGEQEQARDFRAMFGMLRTRYSGFVKGVIVYHLNDFGGGPDDREAHFGLLRVNGSRKPAWYAVRAAARSM